MPQATEKKSGARDAGYTQNKKHRPSTDKLSTGDDVVEPEEDDLDQDESPSDRLRRKDSPEEQNAFKDIQSRIQTSMAELQKTDTWPETFAKRIKEDEKLLKDKLREGLRKREAKHEKFRAGLLTSAHRALAGANESSEKNLVAYASVKAHPLFADYTKTLDHARTLLDDYEALVEHTTHNGGEMVDLSARFKQERSRAAALIKLGKTVTQCNIDMLFQHPRDCSKQNSVLGQFSHEDMTDVKAMLHAGRKNLDEEDRQTTAEDWGAVARAVTRGVKALSRTTEQNQRN